MYIKAHYIGLLCILILFLITGCSSKEIEYDFPLTREDVEELISEKQLSWRIEDEQSFYEGQMVYSLRNDDDVFMSIDSRNVEGARWFSMQFHIPQNSPPTYVSEQLQQFNEEEWLKLFEIAGTFYGNSRDTKRVYHDLLDYLSNRSSVKYGSTSWTKRIDDTHFRVRLSPFKGDLNYYQMDSICIMNNDAFEKYMYSSFEGTNKFFESQKIEVFENITVSDIIALNPENEDTNLCLTVQGRLENIREEIPENFKTLPNTDIPPFKNDFVTATLIDDTGSIRVLLRTTSLNSEELAQDRNHLIYYNTKDKFCVIYISSLTE